MALRDKKDLKIKLKAKIKNAWQSTDRSTTFNVTQNARQQSSNGYWYKTIAIIKGYVTNRIAVTSKLVAQRTGSFCI